MLTAAARPPLVVRPMSRPTSGGSSCARFFCMTAFRRRGLSAGASALAGAPPPALKEKMKGDKNEKNAPSEKGRRLRHDCHIVIGLQPGNSRIIGRRMLRPSKPVVIGYILSRDGTERRKVFRAGRHCP